MTDIIKRVTQFTSENSDIAVMWLYGSRADNTFHENSDYDLAIAFTNFLTDPLEKRLRPEMLALEWQSLLKLNEHTLSIVDINQVPIVLAYEIIQYNKVLFCCDEKRWWREENRIYSRMELDITYSMRVYA
ncbi:MAG: nucleotidyltransferase domain-containing protein [Methylococcaceae bacterium]|nr:nucleotidyltransferase domain-containing protein [Methylococcaceae bacterium]